MELDTEQKTSQQLHLELETRLQDMTASNRMLGEAQRKLEGLSAETITIQAELSSKQNTMKLVRQDLSITRIDLSASYRSLSTTNQYLATTKSILEGSQSSLLVCRKQLDDLHVSAARAETQTSALMKQPETGLTTAHQEISEIKNNFNKTQTKFAKSLKVYDELQISAAKREEESSASIATLTKRADFLEQHPMRTFLHDLM